MQSPLTQKTIILAALCLLALLGACTPTQQGPSPEEIALAVAQTGVALTQTALALPVDVETPVVSTVVPPDPSPTLEAQPTATLSPTPTLTPDWTPTPETPRVSVSVDTNCRSGPGRGYDILGFLLVGESVEVVGRFADSAYWIVKNPDRDGECWLWANYATVTGPADALPVRTPPPTPTPSFSWAGSWTAYFGEAGSDVTINSVINVTVTDRNFSTTMNLGAPVPFVLRGTISEDTLSVSGTWTYFAEEGTFKF